MEIAYVLGGLLLGFIMAFAYFKSALKSNMLEAEKKFESRFTDLSVLKNETETQNRVLQSQLEEMNREKQRFSDLYEKESQEKQEVEKILVVKQAAYVHITEKMDEERKKIEELQNTFKIEFENIAHRILKQNTLDFNESSNKKMMDILTPLKEKIHEFEKKVEDTYQKGLRDQMDLKGEVKKLYDLSVSLDKDARDLTKALKSDNKKQGNWGEVILERVLERSGLIKDQEYMMQYTAKNVEGAVMRPDVLIKLPDDKHLIIDSKVSLTAYTEYMSMDDDILQKTALKRHLESIKQHVKELSAKRYETLEGVNSPDFVLLFMPIEPAFSLAVQVDAELFNYAWGLRVVIVSPTTLLATLRTVASIWKYEKQNQNAMEIAERGGKLYDKFEGFVKDLEAIGLNIERTSKAYQDAHKKLSSGSGNILRQVEQLKEMGVPTKKSLPAQYLEDHG